ncbi:restriction endonuclease subunit S, partial [Mycoplasma leonicaptivi]|uniref:restriction endonuclease subunit S n=1 Tax=Mycoplasma leonicaptivi TaxID=36742 RepID=UPI001B8007E6
MSKFLKPEIRFEGFDSEWEKICLKDYCEFLNGKGLSLEEVKKYGFVKCIHYGSLYTDYGMVIKEVIHKTKSIKNNSIFSKYGDVLIPASDTTPTGLARASSVLEKDVLIGGDVNIIRPNKSILLGSFLSLNINYNKQKLIPLIKGTSVKHIHNSDIKNIYLKISKDINEQKEISKIFINIDDQISMQNLKIKKLENVKKELLQKMFADKDDLVPKIRFEGFVNKWEETELENIVNYRSGSAHENFIEKYGQFKLINSKFISTEGREFKKTSIAFEKLSKNTITMVLSDVPNGKALAKT